MVDISLDVGFEIPDSELRKIQSDLVRSVQNISPQLNINTGDLRRAVDGVLKQDRELRVVGIEGKSELERELRRFAQLKLDAELTPTSIRRVKEELDEAKREFEQLEAEFGEASRRAARSATGTPGQAEAGQADARQALERLNAGRERLRVALQANEDILGRVKRKEEQRIRDTERQLREAQALGDLKRREEEKLLRKALDNEVRNARASRQRREEQRRLDQQTRRNVQGFGTRLAERRRKAVKDSIDAFEKQTKEVLRGQGAQRELFARIRDAVAAQRRQGNLPEQAGGVSGADIRGRGSLQNFAQGLDPTQLRVFKKELAEIERNLRLAARAADRTNGRLSSTELVTGRTAKATKGFAGSLKEVAGRAALAFKRLLLYTVISQIIFGAVRAIKEAVDALIELDTQARRLVFFANITKQAKTGVDGLRTSITTLDDAFSLAINKADRFGISLQEATSALVTAQRVGREADSAFTDTVISLVRLEGGALSAETAVTNLNAITNQFFASLENDQLEKIGVDIESIGLESGFTERAVAGLGATLAIVAAQSSLNVSQLSDVVARVGAAFRGLQQADPTTLIALVGEAASISGAQVGRLSTGLKQAATLSIQNADAIEKLTGVRIFDDTGQVRGLEAILEVLRAAGQAAGRAQQRDILSTLFDRRSLDIGAALVSTVQRLEDRFGDLSSIEARAAFVRENTIKSLRAQTDLSGGLQSALNRLQLSFQRIVSSQEFVDVVIQLVKITQSGIELIGKFAGALNKLPSLFGSNATLLQLFSDVLTVVNANAEQFFGTALRRAFGPLGNLAQLIGTVVGSISGLITGLRGGGNVFSVFATEAKKVGAALLTFFGQNLGILLTPVIVVFKTLGFLAGQAFGDGIKDAVAIISPVTFIGNALFGDDTDINKEASDAAEKLADTFLGDFTKGIGQATSTGLGVPLGDISSEANKIRQLREEAREARIQGAGERAAQAEREADARSRILRQQQAAIRAEEEALANALVQRSIQLTDELRGGQVSVNRQLEIENELRENAGKLARLETNTLASLKPVIDARLAAERRISIEQQKQKDTIEGITNVAAALRSRLTQQGGIELDLRINRRRLEVQLREIRSRINNLGAVLSASIAVGDFETVQKTLEQIGAANRELLKARVEASKQELSARERLLDISFRNSQQQIRAWESASQTVAQTFSRVVNLQKGLADIFNKSGELVSQRLRQNAAALNSFLERTGASLEQRIVASRRQAANEIAALQRNAERQLAALQSFGVDGAAFGTTEEIRAETNRLIDALISANEVAQREIVDSERKFIDEDALARRQAAADLRAEFENRIRASRNEIAIRQRIAQQEIALLQRRIQEEQKFLQLREQQQRQFGSLLLQSPEKFAEAIENFRLAQGFFRGITDTNIDSLQTVQARLEKVLQIGGPQLVRQIVAGLEAGAKFGLAEAIPGFGNEFAKSIVERLVVSTPEELNRSLEQQRRLAQQQTEEQQKIRELQSLQQRLLIRDAELQDAQGRVAALNLTNAIQQRERIIERLDALLAVFKINVDEVKKVSGELKSTSGLGAVDLGANQTEIARAVRDAFRIERREGIATPTTGTPTTRLNEEQLQEIRKQTEAIQGGFTGLGDTFKRFVERPTTGRPEEEVPAGLATARPRVNRDIQEAKRRQREAAEDDKKKISSLQSLNRQLDEQIELNGKLLRVQSVPGGGAQTIGGNVARQAERAAARIFGGNVNQGDDRRILSFFRDLTQNIGGFDTNFIAELKDIFESTKDGIGNRPDADDVRFGQLQEIFRRAGLDGLVDKFEGGSFFDARDFAERFLRISESLTREQKQISTDTTNQIRDILADQIERLIRATGRQGADAPALPGTLGDFEARTQGLIDSLGIAIQSALANGARDLSESIGATIDGKKITVEIPERPVLGEINVNGEITTRISGDDFIESLGLTLERSGLSDREIASIKRRVLELTSRLREGGARIEFDSDLD